MVDMENNEVVLDHNNVVIDHNIRSIYKDSEDALGEFLRIDCYKSIIVAASALNPLLRALESIGSIESAIIIPIVNSKTGKPLYILVKKNKSEKAVSIDLVKSN